VDVVRYWRAPRTGKVEIHAPVNRVTNIIADTKEDGLVVSIQKNKSVIPSFSHQKLEAGNTDIVLQDKEVVDFKNGDIIYFRLESGQMSEANGVNDLVYWNPSIKYQDVLENT